MQSLVVSQLSVKCHGEDVSLACRHRVPIDRAEYLYLGAMLSDPRRANEDAMHRPTLNALHVNICLEAPDLAPNALRSARMSIKPR